MTGGGNHHLMTMWSTPVTSSTILYFSRIWIRSPKYTKLDVAKKVRVRILWGSLESLLGGSGRPPTFCSLSFLGVFVCNSYLWIKQLHIPRSWVFFNCLHHMYENYQKKMQTKNGPKCPLGPSAVALARPIYKMIKTEIQISIQRSSSWATNHITWGDSEGWSDRVR